MLEDYFIRDGTFILSLDLLVTEAWEEILIT
jgi:hypothetical protein